MLRLRGTVSVQPSPTVTRSSDEPGTGFQSSKSLPAAVTTGLSALPTVLSLGVGSRVTGLVAMVWGGLADPRNGRRLATTRTRCRTT